MPEERLFGLDSQTLIQIGIQLLNGIILAVALGYILYKPVKEFLHKRSEGIQNKIDESDATMAKADELINEYNAKIKDIDEERIKILEAARAAAADESKIILEVAKQEANEIKKRSLESISADEKRLKEEARLYIVDLATHIAGKYIAKNMDDEAHDRIFEETLARMENTKWPK